MSENVNRNAPAAVGGDIMAPDALRERIATAAMAALIAKECTPRSAARLAVTYADELVSALQRKDSTT